MVMLLVCLGCNQKDPSEELASIDKRIRNLENIENRLIKERLARLEMQFKEFQEFMVEMDKGQESPAKQVSLPTQKKEKLSESRPSATARQAAKPPEKKKTSSVTKARYHLVKKGETLYSISKKYGVAVDELLRLNKLKKGQAIYPNQKLLVTP